MRNLPRRDYFYKKYNRKPESGGIQLRPFKPCVKAGDEIAVSIMEHHSNLLPWQMVARQTGAVLKFLECTQEGTLPDEVLEAAITEKTKLVAVAQVSNVLGCVNPVEKIVKLAHEKGAVVVVDAAQSAPHMPVDVHGTGCRFSRIFGSQTHGTDGNRCIIRKRRTVREDAAIFNGRRNDFFRDKRGRNVC